MEQRIKSFEAFYPYYLSEHKEPGTRRTHFLGTSFFIGLFLYAVISSWYWAILVGVASAYGMAWAGHYFIEKNKPATFRYPLWSLMSDFKLYFDILSGKESFTSGRHDALSEDGDSTL